MYIMIWRSFSSASTAFSSRPQLRVGEIERNAEHRLLIGAAPLVGQVADRPELLQPAPLELLVELPDVAFDRGSLDAQAELADLLPEDPADLGVQGLESDHAADYHRFSCISASVFPSPSLKNAIHSS